MPRAPLAPGGPRRTRASPRQSGSLPREAEVKQGPIPANLLDDNVASRVAGANAPASRFIRSTPAAPVRRAYSPLALTSPRLASTVPLRRRREQVRAELPIGLLLPFVATGLERDRPAHRWRRSLSCRERLRWRSGTGCAAPPSARCGRAPWRACGACSDSASVPSESRAWRGGWPRSARSVPGSGGR